MKIKKGDSVIVISGADRSKTGKVLSSFPREGKVLVEGVNVKKRHQRARRASSKGQVVERALPLPVSKVMLVDPKTGKGTRVGIKRAGGKRVRVARKSGAEIA